MTVTIKRNRVSSIEDFEKRFEKKTNTNIKYPTRVGYKGRNIFSVRFLTEPNQWVDYGQYYDPSTKRYVIATEENEESFDSRGIKPSYLYLASALDVETGEVLVLELKYTMAKEIKAIRDKKGDITTYDIELEKRGEGKETEYRAAYDGKSTVDVARYEIPDGFDSWQNYLWVVVERLAGTGEDDSDDDVDDDTDSDDTDEAEEEKPAVAKKTISLKRK